MRFIKLVFTAMVLSSFLLNIKLVFAKVKFFKTIMSTVKNLENWQKGEKAISGTLKAITAG